jgi:hypothetical protein
VTDATHAVARGPARLASVSIGIVAIAAAIEGVLLLRRAAQIGDADDLGSAYSLAVTGNGLLDALAIVIAVASLSALAGWLAWQYRAASILAAGDRPPAHTPQWAVLWWFIPVANLWMPGGTNAELWRGSGRSTHAWPVWAWWVTFILGWVSHAVGHALRQGILNGGSWGSPAGPSFFPPDDVVTLVRVASVIAGVGALVIVAASPLALLILRGITRRLSVIPLAAPSRPDVAASSLEDASSGSKASVVPGLRPARSDPLATAVTVLLAIQMVTLVLSALAGLPHLALYRRISRGEFVPPEHVENARALVGGASIVWIVVFLVSVLIWCIWQHRAQQVAIDLTAGRSAFTPGWAVAWWFIPLANLVVPYLAIRDLWRSSHTPPGTVSARKTWWVLPWWWATWVGWLALAVIGGATDTRTAHGIVIQDAINASAFAGAALSAGLAIVIVRAVSRLQVRAIAFGVSPPPRAGTAFPSLPAPPRIP